MLVAPGVAVFIQHAAEEKVKHKPGNRWIAVVVCSPLVRRYSHYEMVPAGRNAGGFSLLSAIRCPMLEDAL